MAAMPITLGDLQLHNNRIRSLPTTLGLLTNITTLRLDGNELTELPAEIGRLTSLIGDTSALNIQVIFQVCIGAEGYCSNIVHRLLYEALHAHVFAETVVAKRHNSHNKTKPADLTSAHTLSSSANAGQ